jgi:hypothetical protein
LFELTAKRPPHRNPKITVAIGISSRRPLPHLEAIEEVYHAPESASPPCILSWCRRRPGVAVTLPAASRNPSPRSELPSSSLWFVGSRSKGPS